MASAHDVAAYILNQQGSMTTWKLQKLVYYSQAWHLVWANEPLFSDRIEAWPNGPVVRSLYQKHRRKYSVEKWSVGDPGKLSEDEKLTLDRVLRGYGDLSGHALSRITHRERPWLEAREDLAPIEPCLNQISLSSMAEFYQALDASENSMPVAEIDWDSLGEPS